MLNGTSMQNYSLRLAKEFVVVGWDGLKLTTESSINPGSCVALVMVWL